jgi:predicted ferric reductase
MLRITLIAVLLWLPNLIVGWSEMDSFFDWRHQLIMLTGFISLGYMSLAVLLSTRFSWVEAIVRGVDKGYAWHKKLGIGATISLILHWGSIKSAHWFIDAGWIDVPNRGPRPAIEGINWHALAENVGDVSFKVFLIFSLISLLQAISYKRFKFTHKLGGILMLAGVFHTAFLLDWNIQSAAMNVAIAVMSIVGIWGAVWSLTGKIGKNNKSKGRVINVERFTPEQNKAMAVRFTIQLDSGLKYKEGQFSYLNFHDGESPHPFSILNYDIESKRIEFGVKDLGDYTHKLVNTLDTGMMVTVEGGYGYFQLPTLERQVWVGAGIGIVPFISRLYWLKCNADKQQTTLEKVHLFYCVNSEKEAFFSKEIAKIITQLDFVELYILDAEKGQRLDSKQIVEMMGEKPFDVSFCGPESFGNALKLNLVHSGLPQSRFQKEIFRMR